MENWSWPKKGKIECYLLVGLPPYQIVCVAKIQVQLKLSSIIKTEEELGVLGIVLEKGINAGGFGDRGIESMTVGREG